MSNEGESKKKVELDREVLERYESMKSLKPLRKGEYWGSEQDKSYVALSEEEVYELSPLAFYVWSLCDGEHSIEDMAHMISEAAEVELERVIEPLIVVLDEMKKVGLVEY